jgi:hypothetical protein
VRYAVIPAADGGRVIAWTCSGPERCNGRCGRPFRTEAHGAPEDIALDHAAKFGVEAGHVHTVNSGCRGQTFKVWRGARGLEAREIL